MRRIETPTKATIKTDDDKEVDGFKGAKTAGDVATHLSPEWCNNVQEEVCSVIEAVGSEVNTKTITHSNMAVEYIETFSQLKNAVFAMADSACPVGSLKAFSSEKMLEESLLATWVPCNASDAGAFWLSEEMVNASSQIAGNTQGFYKINDSTMLLKWAECSGTFPLPVAFGRSTWGKDELEALTGGATITPSSPLHQAIGALKPKIVENFNGGYENEVFLAGSNKSDFIKAVLTDGAAFSDREGHQAVVMGDAIYVIGGYDGSYKNDVWKSTNGAQWQLVTNDAAFTAREKHQAVVMGDAIYVIGGHDGSYKNDVWKSTDGVQWQPVTHIAPFSARRGHQAVVLGDAIYVIGGEGNGYRNDVWKSTDGAQWTSVAVNATIFSARRGHQAVVHKGAIYVIGGFDGENRNDVWRSTDGAQWQLVTAAADFSARRRHQAVVMGGAIYVISGQGNSNEDDVWRSTDGAQWTSLPSTQTFNGRDNHQAVVMGGAIYVIGGRVALLNQGPVARKSDVLVLELARQAIASINLRAITEGEMPPHKHSIVHRHIARSNNAGIHRHTMVADPGHTHMYAVDTKTGGIGGTKKMINTNIIEAIANEFPLTNQDGAHAHEIAQAGSHNHIVGVDDNDGAEGSETTGVSGNAGGERLVNIDRNGNIETTLTTKYLDRRPRHALVKYYMRVQ